MPIPGPAGEFCIAERMRSQRHEEAWLPKSREAGLALLRVMDESACWNSSKILAPSDYAITGLSLEPKL